MKTSRKLLSLIVAIAVIVGTFTAVMSVAAAPSYVSDGSDGIVFKLNSYDRHYGWGEWAQTITYTSGGYATMSDTGRFVRQQQLYMPLHSDTDKAKAEEAIKLALDEYEGIIAVDILVEQCSGSNFEEVQTDVGCEVRVDISYRYKHPDYYDEEENPESWVSGSMTAQKWIGFNSPATYKISVEDYNMFNPESDEYDEDCTDFEVTSFRVNCMNYANNAFTTGDYKGQAGLGFNKVTYSPFYILGAIETPEKGEDLGTNVTFTPNAEDPKAAGTFTINGKEYAQLDDGTQTHGPYGNGSDMVRVDDVLYGDVNADGKVNTKDVLALRKYLAKWDVTIDTEAADCNADGSVNTKDVLLLRKYLANWPVVLG